MPGRAARRVGYCAHDPAPAAGREGGGGGRGGRPGAAQLFGCSPEEAIGRPIDDLVLEEDLREEGRAVTREALDRGRADRITRRVRKDGKPVDVQMMLVSLTAGDERVGFYAIYHDITQ